ncbi:acyl-activating enzyme, partial [Jimgerdemannia flammicorona]
REKSRLYIPPSHPPFPSRLLLRQISAFFILFTTSYLHQPPPPLLLPIMDEDHVNPPDPIIPVPARLKQNPTPFVDSLEKYKQMYKESIENGDEFFRKLANELLTWFRPFQTVRYGTFEQGDVAWFLEGQLNASYNCVDRHALRTPDRVAIIHEGDEPDQVRKITYAELLREVCKLANVLKSLGVRKGDNVAIYMPMIPEAVVSFLACARIGAVHSVVFAGFSSESLRDRIQDCAAKIVITADEGRRGGKSIGTKRIVDDALRDCPSIQHVLVTRRTGAPVPITPGRDKWYHEELANARPWCPAEHMSSEDPLYLLYTSGSTGKPKGVVHTTGGYLLGATATVKYVFDYHENDIFACMADIGWVTGHSYIIYGPLSLGATSLLFESTPTYPNPSRFWEVVAKHKITQFYTAPTAIRALRRLGDSWVEGHDLSSLRVIGSVGEPINPEAWEWYNEKVGKGHCAVVDTYWQTETGSIIICPLPGAVPTKPGSATFPFFGIDPAVLEPQTGKELIGNDVTGVLVIKKPWPSMARTVYGNHHRYLDTYMKPYPGHYFTGDGVTRDKDGYYWIGGRVDDVINVSGHRLSTAEIESALILHHAVAEAAVVGGHDDLTGQCIHSFTTLKPNIEDSIGLEKELALQVRKVIGPFATPKRIYVVQSLPKTRSGKIMRRVLRKIVNGEGDQLGDVSTLEDTTVIPSLIGKVSSTH